MLTPARRLPFKVCETTLALFVSADHWLMERQQQVAAAGRHITDNGTISGEMALTGDGPSQFQFMTRQGGRGGGRQSEVRQATLNASDSPSLGKIIGIILFGLKIERKSNSRQRWRSAVVAEKAKNEDELIFSPLLHSKTNLVEGDSE